MHVKVNAFFMEVLESRIASIVIQRSATGLWYLQFHKNWFRESAVQYLFIKVQYVMVWF